MIKDTKLFGILSLFDLFVLVFIIAVVIGTVYKFRSPAADVEAGQETIEYTVKIAGVRDFTLQYYKEGLPCYDVKTGELIGTISAVRSGAYEIPVGDKDGDMKIAAVPEMLRIDIDIVTDGLESDQAYYARGTYELKVGSEINFYTKYAEILGTVEDIKVID